MDSLEKYIEKLQNLGHDEKKKIMWVGVPIIMALVIVFWFSYSDFGVKEDYGSVESQEVSKFEIFKNGLKVSFEEIKKVFNDFKGKINETNSFNIDIQENTPENYEAVAEIKSIFEEVVSTTTTN